MCQILALSHKICCDYSIYNQLSRIMYTGGIGLDHIKIFIRKFCNYLASLVHEAKATNSAIIVESTIQICFFEPHEVVYPLKL